MRRLERSKLSLTIWAAIGIGGLVLALFLGFFGTGPVGGSPYQAKALFRSDAELKPRAQVRVAGVPVGEVASVTPVGGDSEEANAVEVTMNLEDQALPLHTDARAAIKSRLIFEGNFYIALDPGSPGTPEMEDGDTIPADRTTGPVQLDRVLSDLPANSRNDFRTVVQGLGQTLTDTDGEGGESTSQALNDALADAPAAFKGFAQTFDGLQGLNEGDLSKLIRGSDATFAGFANEEAALAELITNFNLTMQATASRQDELSRSIALLDPTVHNAETAFVELERALPNTTTLARELIPGMNGLPSTIEAVTPWLPEATKFISPAEGGGLVKQLIPVFRNVNKFAVDFAPTLDHIGGFSRCWSHNLIPTGDVVINDPPFGTGATAEQEFFQGWTGLASATQNFDGNGHYARAQVAGGDTLVQTENLPGFGISRAFAVYPLLGTRPAYTNNAPPINFDSDCASNAPPDLNSAATGGTP